MTVSIIHAFLCWVLGVLVPGNGRRRAVPRPVASDPVSVSEPPRLASRTLPAHRSPYGLPVPLDGHAAASVRPYVLAAERAREREWVWQCRRRVALVLTADFGVYLDRHLIGAEGVA